MQISHLLTAPTDATNYICWRLLTYSGCRMHGNIHYILHSTWWWRHHLQTSTLFTHTLYLMVKTSLTNIYTLHPHSTWWWRHHLQTSTLFTHTLYLMVKTSLTTIYTLHPHTLLGGEDVTYKHLHSSPTHSTWWWRRHLQTSTLFTHTLYLVVKTSLTNIYTLHPHSTWWWRHHLQTSTLFTHTLYLVVKTSLTNIYTLHPHSTWWWRHHLQTSTLFTHTLYLMVKTSLTNIYTLHPHSTWWWRHHLQTSTLFTHTLYLVVKTSLTNIYTLHPHTLLDGEDVTYKHLHSSPTHSTWWWRRHLQTSTLFTHTLYLMVKTSLTNIYTLHPHTLLGGEDVTYKHLHSSPTHSTWWWRRHLQTSTLFTHTLYLVVKTSLTNIYTLHPHTLLDGEDVTYKHLHSSPTHSTWWWRRHLQTSTLFTHTLYLMVKTSLTNIHTLHPHTLLDGEDVTYKHLHSSPTHSTWWWRHHLQTSTLFTHTLYLMVKTSLTNIYTLHPHTLLDGEDITYKHLHSSPTHSTWWWRHHLQTSTLFTHTLYLMVKTSLTNIYTLHPHTLLDGEDVTYKHLHSSPTHSTWWWRRHLQTSTLFTHTLYLMVETSLTNIHTLHPHTLLGGKDVTYKHLHSSPTHSTWWWRHHLQTSTLFTYTLLDGEDVTYKHPHSSPTLYLMVKTSLTNIHTLHLHSTWWWRRHLQTSTLFTHTLLDGEDVTYKHPHSSPTLYLMVKTSLTNIYTLHPYIQCICQ